MEQQIELTAETLWNDVSARLREALNDTTYSTWFGEVDGAELDGDTFVRRRPERLHARVDRGAFPRPDPRRGQGRRRRATLRVQLRVESASRPQPRSGRGERCPERRARRCRPR